MAIAKKQKILKGGSKAKSKSSKSTVASGVDLFVSSNARKLFNGSMPVRTFYSSEASDITYLFNKEKIARRTKLLFTLNLAFLIGASVFVWSIFPQLLELKAVPVVMRTMISTTTGEIQYAKARVNIRNEASMTGKIVGKLSAGEKVMIRRSSGPWKKVYAIEASGKVSGVARGYVYAPLLARKK